MFAGVNLAANLNPAAGSADYTPVGTVNGDGVLQTGSLHLRRAQATNLASGDFFEVAEYINETNPSGSVQGLLSAPFSGVGGQLLRNGCNQMADGASTIGDITGDANGLSGTALRCFAENYIGINPQFDEGADYVTNTGSSGYHSLQTQFTLRPTFGTNLRATYTWSKSMALSADSWTDPLNRNADWTLAGNHRTHDFRVNGTFQLPIGPGQLLLGNSSGFLARAVEGWRMSWIYSAVSGAPLSVSTFTDGGGGTGVNMFYANGTPDVVGDFDLRSGNVEWGADIGAADLGGGYLDGFTVVEDPQCVGITDFTDAMGWNFRSQGDCELTAVADGSGQVVLQNPMPGTRGNLGQRTVEGPGDWSLDASLSKDFQVSERMMFQLRVDAENVLNHPSPDDPLLNINDTDIPWGFIEEKSNDSRTFEIQMRLNF
jgi:hypothetical protein